MALFDWFKRRVMKRPELFVIFGTKRSGSNLLQEKLNYFDDLICLGELYNPKYVGTGRPHLHSMEYAGWSRGDEAALERRNEDPPRLLKDVLERARQEDKILGFRHFDGHDRSIRREMLRRRDVPKVFLTRSLVDSFVSLEMARDTGEWIKRSETAASPSQVRFDVQRYQKYAERLRKYYQGLERKLNESGQSYMHVSYQDVLSDDTVAEIARFVGSRSAMSSRETILKKQSSGTLKDKLVNYDEVAEFIETCTPDPLKRPPAGT